jgi:hypothetical protein
VFDNNNLRLYFNTYHMALYSCFLFALGIISNPLADQTTVLQNLLNKQAGKAVTFPVGTYMVRTLTVPKHTRLTIQAKTIIKGLPTDQSVPVLILSSGVSVTGAGTVDGNRTVRRKGVGIKIADAESVTISGLRIREVAEQGVQIVNCKKIALIRLKVDGCGVKGINQFQGINVVISQNIQITGCQVAKAQHGIQWWGDDTNGWCDNLRINGNKVSHVDGGGIWGNKGRNITVTSNTTEFCGDVGVDFENSYDCSATGNTVRNCKNYALAVFHSSARIRFINNKVYQALKYGHGIGLLGEGVSKQISFIGGSINTKGATSCGLVTVGTNVAQDVLVKGARITTEGKGAIPIRVLDNNRFQIINNPLISGVSPTGISLEGSSQSVIDGNTIVHQGPDASNFGERGGIFVYFRSADYPAQNNQIRRNIIRGYRTGINDECWGNVNSNNLFEQNITPNLVHRSAEGVWGGKNSQNRTEAKQATPVEIRQ